MHAAAFEVIQAMRALAARGRSVLTETLAPGAAPEQALCQEWTHYPPDDLFAPERGGLAYYHAHSADERAPDEHGHFHLFASPHRAPVLERRSFVHLLGVSLDALGQPIRLFTTNRWVTDESWRAAPAVLRLASRFELPGRKPSRALNRWLSALPTLFRPQLEFLLARRDAKIQAHIIRRQHRRPAETASKARAHVLEDRSVHVLSQCRIDLHKQILAIEHALALRAGHQRARQGLRTA